MEIGLSVGQLRKYLAEHTEIPDDARVHYQRIDDVYFRENGWDCTPFIWDVTKYGAHWNEAIRAFSCNYFPTAGGERVFVIHAHY